MDPGKDWMDFLNTLTAETSIAVDHAQLFKDLEKSNKDLAIANETTPEGWAKTLELRDRETEGHSQCVLDLMVRIAQKLGIEQDEMVHIKRGSLLHDIGKMGVLDNILLKEGPLDEQEWEIMKTHPELAYRMLSTIPFLENALEIPYSHHEKWDGSGYPRGLRREEIPLSARIFAIVDVWDALRADRPYRKAWSDEKAMDYIRSESGKHFDPMVVHAFLDIVKIEKRNSRKK
jgi:HD-GYP domain-containing protein (c-di-GMP phosphodiesterase class II)